MRVEACQNVEAQARKNATQHTSPATSSLYHLPDSTDDWRQTKSSDSPIHPHSTALWYFPSCVDRTSRRCRQVVSSPADHLTQRSTSSRQPTATLSPPRPHSPVPSHKSPSVSPPAQHYDTAASTHSESPSPPLLTAPVSRSMSAELPLPVHRLRVDHLGDLVSRAWIWGLWFSASLAMIYHSLRVEELKRRTGDPSKKDKDRFLILLLRKFLSAMVVRDVINTTRHASDILSGGMKRRK